MGEGKPDREYFMHRNPVSRNTEAGYDIGEKLIVTYEMADYVLNMGVVEKLIEKY